MDGSVLDGHVWVVHGAVDWEEGKTAAARSVEVGSLPSWKTYGSCFPVHISCIFCSTSYHDSAHDLSHLQPSTEPRIHSIHIHIISRTHLTLRTVTIILTSHGVNIPFSVQHT